MFVAVLPPPDVSDTNFTEAVTCAVWTLAIFNPITTVVVLLGVVYKSSGVPADAGMTSWLTQRKLLGIFILLYHESAMLSAVASSAMSDVSATVPAVAGRVKVMFPLNAL